MPSRRTARRWPAPRPAPTSASGVRTILDGSRELDAAVCEQLQHAVALSSDGTLEILAAASQIQQQAAALADQVAPVQAASQSARGDIAAQAAALRSLARTQDLSPRLAATLAGIAQSLASGVDALARTGETLASALDAHAQATDTQVGRLLGAGQLHDVFRQVIERTAPALQSRAELLERLVLAMAGGASVGALALTAAGLVESYRRAESAHRDPQADVSGNVDFF